jgi:hypothetical protein
MRNNNYPNMFDEKIADDTFLDSLHAIAKEPLSNKILSFIHPVRSVVMVIFLLFYGNSIFESLSKIYWHYYAQFTTKLINIEIASSYGVGIVEFIFSNATFLN